MSQRYTPLGYSARAIPTGEFVQAAWCVPTGAAGRAEYLLEAKRAPAADLVSTRPQGLDPVRDAFASFVSGAWEWMDAHEWSPVASGGPNPPSDA